MAISTKYLSLASMILISLSLIACSSEPSAPLINASVVAYSQESIISAGSNFSFNITVTNTGDNKSFPITIDYAIFSVTEKSEISKESENVVLESWVYKDKKIEIPSTSNAGDYQLEAIVSFGENGTAKTGAFFTVSAPVIEMNKTKPGVNKNASDKTKTAATTGSPAQSVNGSTTHETSSESNTTTNQTQSEPAEVIVEHKERAFVPEVVKVVPGTTIKWIQRDKTGAEVEGPGFHSESLGINGEFKHKFTKPGIYEYYSQLTKAGGTIIVEDPDHPLEIKRDPMSFKGGLNS